jgi:DNA-binding Xre family transcriptional regulator
MELKMIQQIPQKRRRGFLASQAGVIKMEAQMAKKGYTQEELANATNLSVDRVKRFMNPHWNYKIQKDAIIKIAGALDLDPNDLIKIG